MDQLSSTAAVIIVLGTNLVVGLFTWLAARAGPALSRAEQRRERERDDIIRLMDQLTEVLKTVGDQMRAYGNGAHPGEALAMDALLAQSRVNAAIAIVGAPVFEELSTSWNAAMQIFAADDDSVVTLEDRTNAGVELGRILTEMQASAGRVYREKLTRRSWRS